MPNYFPEGNAPLQSDTPIRSLQKINSLLAGGGSGGNATVPEPYATSPGAQQFVDYAVAGVGGGDLVISGSAIIPNPAIFAEVPPSSPILPPQAYVDNIQKFISTNMGQSLQPVLVNQGITRLLLDDIIDDPTLIETIDTSENALELASITDILTFLNDGNQHVIDISLGTNADPVNGAANADVWAIATIGGGVSFNVNGLLAVVKAQSENVGTFTPCELTAAQVNALLAFLVSDYLSLAWTLNIDGTCAAPTGQGLLDKSALQGGGWTVNSN